MSSRWWIIASLHLLLMVSPLSAISQAIQGPVAWWKFNEGSGNVARDSASGTQDAILNNHQWVQGVSGSALKFDGFTTLVSRNPKDLPPLSRHFTIEAWIALQSYPWNWVAIVDQEKDRKSGYYFGVDGEGRLGLQLAVWDTWQICRSETRLPLMRWVHVAATYDSKIGITLYINGQIAGKLPVTGQLTPAKDVGLQIGRNFQELPPIANVRPYEKFPASYSLDGVLDELKIYDRALSPGEIARSYSGVKKPGTTPLIARHWPSLPHATAFGAVYTHLNLYPEWDALWRVGPYADVVVNFTDAPFHYVFWHGANFGDGMVTGNGIWIGDQSFESHTVSDGHHLTAEHMNDKHNMHSSIAIVENTPARVVLHWRYGLVDVIGRFSNPDPLTDWGDWADEYFYIYPDGTAVRFGTIHGTASHYSFTEPTILLEPGKKAEDYVSLQAATIANPQGESRTYSWANSFPQFPFPNQPINANLALINLKSIYKPFYIYPSGTGLGPYGWAPELRSTYSHFPTWNHWPVNQIPSDGRFALFPDHFSSAAVMSPETHLVELPGPLPTKGTYFLFGLTNQPISALAALDRSWVHPPDITVVKGSFTATYDPSQRAYILTRLPLARIEEKTSLELTLSASEGSPVVNPAFVIKGWGDRQTEIRIDGSRLPKEKIREGFVRQLETTDLILWIQYQSTHKFQLTINIQDKNSPWHSQ